MPSVASTPATKGGIYIGITSACSPLPDRGIIAGKGAFSTSSGFSSLGKRSSDFTVYIHVVDLAKQCANTESQSETSKRRAKIA